MLDRHAIVRELGSLVVFFWEKLVLEVHDNLMRVIIAFFTFLFLSILLGLLLFFTTLPVVHSVVVHKIVHLVAAVVTAVLFSIPVIVARGAFSMVAFDIPRAFMIA